MARSFIRRGCYGQAPSLNRARPNLAALGPRPTDLKALKQWLWDISVRATDTPIEVRNAAAIELRSLGGI